MLGFRPAPSLVLCFTDSPTSAGHVQSPSGVPSAPAYVNSAKPSRDKTLALSADKVDLGAPYSLHC